MTLRELRRAARRRIRAWQDESESGFVLIYVLMITTIVTILVGSVLTVASSSIVPSVQSAYSEAADAAAQGGLQAFLAKINSLSAGTGACANVDAGNAACAAGVASGSATISPSGSGQRSTYSWVAKPLGTTGMFRVISTGQVTNGGVTGKRSLVADLGSTTCLSFSVCTHLETEAPDMAMQRFPQRSIWLPAPTNSISWNGASAANVNVCNSGYTTGRGANQLSPAAPPYSDWSETSSDGTATQYQPCQVSLGSSTKLIAPSDPSGGPGGYYTGDALLLSNSLPGGGSGPSFGQPVYTGYQNSAGVNDCSNPNQHYRSFNLFCYGYPTEVGGTPAGAYTPQYLAGGPAQPTRNSAFPGNLTVGTYCIYNGPTRVRLTGGTATVTSPQTTSTWKNGLAAGSPALGSAPACWGSGLTAAGLVAAPVNLAGISAIYVQNDGTAPSGTPTQTTPATPATTSTGWNTTGQGPATLAPTVSTCATSTSTVFCLAASTPAPTPTTTAANDQCGNTLSTPTASCAWTQTVNPPGQPDGNGGWSAYSRTKNCWAVGRNLDTPNGPKPWDEQTFDCDWFGQMGSTGYTPAPPPADGYSLLRTAVTTALASTTPVTVTGSGNAGTNGLTCPATQSFVPSAATTTPQQLACLIQNNMEPANTNHNHAYWSNPPTSGYTHQYVVSAINSATTSKANQVLNPAPSLGTENDPFFQQSVPPAPQTATVTTTTTTFSIGSQVYGCYNYGLVGGLLGSPSGTMDIDGSNCTNILLPTGKWAWGNGYYPNQFSSQFQVTVTQTSYSNVSGGQEVANFPYTSDVTQYAVGSGATNGPGDLYVDGTASNSLALVAQNDAVVTGSLGSSNAPTNALEVVGDNNVRVYHPVSCVDTTTAHYGAAPLTSPGWCAGDLTGLYSLTNPPSSIITSAGQLGTSHPSLQYTNFPSASLPNGSSPIAINGVLVALGSIASSALQPSGGGGVSGGEFTVDNFNRGVGLGTLAVTGSVVQSHHGPLGEEWEVPDVAGLTSRPYSGYHLNATYQNLRTAIGHLPPVLSTSASWHIVSVSTSSTS